MSDDPNSVRNQPALTTSTGTVWLSVGGVFVAVALAVFIPLIDLRPRGLALAAAITVVAIYPAMVVVRVLVRLARQRLICLAAGMLAIAVVSLATAAIIASEAALG